ncbi:MAG: hypothetical protein J0H29_02030 [Sphingobacteriales bacterium]|nr:hypothetical protein [Sphingobacteriales bacterium]OJY88024.1 MAG: hypothetical protein BGP14_21540 [Sphingobacteriales bacterium 44-15]
MSMISKSRYLAVALSAFVFFSCKKDDTPAPAPPEPTLFEKVQGRWDATVEPVGRIASSSNASHKSLEMPRVASVSFFEDSSYILVFNYGKAYYGKLSVIDSASFDFKDFGPISNIQITADSISFSYVYNETQFSAKAGKADDVAVADAQKPLLKTWVMANEEDGAAYYEEQEAEEGNVKFLFTSAGLFLATNNNGETWTAQNWKWHPDAANAVVLYNGSADDINYNVYYKIVELSNSSLKVEQTVIEEEQEPSVAATYVFNAVK